MADTKFDVWGVLEIMGHVKLAGRITEESIAGAGMIRIDVPAVCGKSPFTRWFGSGSIYSITPMTEELAVGAAKTLGAEPICVYDLPAELREKLRAPALPAPDGEVYAAVDEPDDCEEEDDEYDEPGLDDWE